MSYDKSIDGHILSLVQNFEIAEQSELQEMLLARGYEIPQATLSRRLKKLKIAKVEGKYQVVDLNLPTLPLVLNVQVSEFGLIVLQTHPGNASSLAYYLDQKYVTFRPTQPKNSGIIGTIAGDDTVLLIIKSKHEVKKVINILKEEFAYLMIKEN